MRDDTLDSPESSPLNLRRRRFLVTTTSAAAAAGGILALWPFIDSMNPSARARAAGAPVEVDIEKIEPGMQITVSWQGKPVWVLHRTRQMLDNLKNPKLLERLRDPDSKVETQQPLYCRNAYRSIKPEYLVVIGICTHLGCIPTYRPEIAPPDLGPDWLGGYFCPCHGSRFDLAARVFKGVPAPTNLVVPPYHYLKEKVVQIGVGPKKE